MLQNEQIDNKKQKSSDQSDLRIAQHCSSIKINKQIIRTTDETKMYSFQSW